jgi:hypothetical protein
MDRGALKMLWGTFQIVQSVSFNLDVRFPEPYSTFTRMLSFVQVDFLSMDCLQSNYYYGVYFASFFPLVIVLMIWGVFALRLLGVTATERMTGTDSRTTRTRLFAAHMQAFLMLVYVVVPPVSNIQFKALSCMKLENGDSYLRADTSIDCNSDGYAFFRNVDIILVLIYQSMPLLYIVLLLRVRDRLQPAASSSELALQLRDNDEQLASVRFLFQDYQCAWWFFEVLDMYRRIIFISVLPLLGRDNVGRAYSGVALSLLSCIYYRESTPFRMPYTNFLAVVAQYVILLAYMAALLLATDSLGVIGMSDFVLGILLCVTNVFIVLAAIHFGRVKYEQFRAEKYAEVLAKTIKIEHASGFNDTKFNTTFEYVMLRSVPPSHTLCFYYTSQKEAKNIVANGRIPAIVLGVNGAGDG